MSATRSAGRTIPVGVQLGTVSTVERALVDAAGSVAPGGVGWSLEWWIGADDRWHVPAREPAVRQSRVDHLPVVETAMRVPGGDAVERAYAAQSASGPVVVIEIENKTAVPFAVALAIRPSSAGRPGSVRRINVRETVVEVDGAIALVLPKPPARVAGDCSGQVLGVVSAGDARAPDGSAVLDCDGGAGDAALVFPLTHRATLQVLLPLDRHRQQPTIAAVPPVDAVVRGWHAQLARGARIEVPDDGSRRILDEGRSDLLLFHAGEDVVTWPGDPVPWTVASQVIEALDLFGFAAEAEELLAAVADEQRLDGAIISPDGAMAANGAVLWALARHWQLTRDDALVEQLVVLVAKAGHWIDKRRRSRRRSLLRDGSPADVAWSIRGLTAMAPVLARCGQPEVSDDFATFAARLQAAGAPRDGEPDSPEPPETSAPAPDPAAVAASLRSIRCDLVNEEPGLLSLCNRVPESWLGQSWEAHELPTSFGRLGFAVRWHGERPALLWELDPHDVGRAVTFAAPGLDPEWRADALSGEVLLSPVEPAGRPAGAGTPSGGGAGTPSGGGAGASSSFG